MRAFTRWDPRFEHGLAARHIVRLDRIFACQADQ